MTYLKFPVYQNGRRKRLKFCLSSTPKRLNPHWDELVEIYWLTVGTWKTLSERKSTRPNKSFSIHSARNFRAVQTRHWILQQGSQNVQQMTTVVVSSGVEHIFALKSDHLNRNFCCALELKFMRRFEALFITTYFVIYFTKAFSRLSKLFGSWLKWKALETSSIVLTTKNCFRLNVAINFHYPSQTRGKIANGTNAMPNVPWITIVELLADSSSNLPSNWQ